MKASLLAGFALAALLALAVPAPAADEKDLADTITGSKNHTILATAVKEAGLTVMFKGKGPHTVFAPTDAAFKKLGDDKIRAVVKDKELLKKILLSHVLSGKVTAADLAAMNGKDVTTLSGAMFPVTAAGKTFKIGDATATPPELKCTNGVIHEIDTVLMPK